jgi:hypothetical protein
MRRTSNNICAHSGTRYNIHHRTSPCDGISRGHVPPTVRCNISRSATAGTPVSYLHEAAKPEHSAAFLGRSRHMKRRSRGPVCDIRTHVMDQGKPVIQPTNHVILVPLVSFWPPPSSDSGSLLPCRNSGQNSTNEHCPY